MLEASSRQAGRKPAGARMSGANFPGQEVKNIPNQPALIETMLERENMLRALQAVERNGGAAGIDGMTTGQLRPFLQTHWAIIKEQLLKGEYRPRPVRRVDIPKPRGGTPQGGPLSPLLSHILLDDLDKELEQRGHKFCRYADDCNIYVGSQRAGQRVLASVGKCLTERLRLRLNPLKSGVDRPWKRRL